MSKKNKTEVIDAPSISTTEQIQAFLTTLVEMTSILTVDEDFTVVERESGEPVQILGADGENKTLVLYQDKFPSVEGLIILNPFTEHSLDTPDKNFLYSNLLNGTLSNIGMVIYERVMEECLERKEKPKKGKKKVKETIEDIELLSPLISHVQDKKMLTEFEAILKHLGSKNTFLNIAYNSKNMTASLHHALTDKRLPKALGKRVRKGSWDRFKKITDIIFGDLNKNYVVTSDIVACPRIDATMKCLYELFSHIKGFLDLIGLEFDLEEFKGHIERFPTYKAKAQWLVQTAATKKKNDQANHEAEKERIRNAQLQTPSTAAKASAGKVVGRPQVQQQAPASKVVGRQHGSTRGLTVGGRPAAPQPRGGGRVVGRNQSPHMIPATSVVGRQSGPLSHGPMLSRDVGQSRTGLTMPGAVRNSYR